MLAIWWSKVWAASIRSGQSGPPLPPTLLSGGGRVPPSVSELQRHVHTDLCWWEGGTHSAPPTLSVPCICVSLIVWTLTFSPVHLFQAELCFKSPFPSSAHSAARPTDEAMLWLRHGAGVMRLRLSSSWRGLASPCTGTHTAAPPLLSCPPDSGQCYQYLMK